MSIINAHLSLCANTLKTLNNGGCMKDNVDAQGPLNNSKVGCLYCDQPIGEPHKWECVTLRKKVMIQATLKYEIDVPRSWNNEQILFHRTESSWCEDGFITEMEKLSEKNGCLCGANIDWKIAEEDV